MPWAPTPTCLPTSSTKSTRTKSSSTASGPAGASVDYALKARIKWLLKRLSLLNSRDENGKPAPKDWDVLIVKDRRNPSQCYAHPVIPATGADDDATRSPASPLLEVAR